MIEDKCPSAYRVLSSWYFSVLSYSPAAFQWLHKLYNPYTTLFRSNKKLLYTDSG